MSAKFLIYPIFLPMQGCPGRCVYCDQNKLSGSGELDLEIALEGVKAFIERNPGRIKQVAFYGGSFTALAEEFRTILIERMKACIDLQTTFRVSTHPLHVDHSVLYWCARHNVRTIELGIQDFSDEVLGASGRGYSGREALEAAARVQEHGFELGVQLMPGLPGWSEASIKLNHETLAKLKPDFLRLYPLIVIRGTSLERLFREGKYLPLTLDQAVAQCADYSLLAEKNQIRVIKLGVPSNLDPQEIVAGPWHPSFGELVRTELLHRGIQATQGSGERSKLTKLEISLLKTHGGVRFSKISQNVDLINIV